MTASRAARLSRLRDRFIAANMRSRSIRLFRETRSGAIDLHRLAQVEPRALDKILDALGRSDGKERTVELAPLRAEPGTDAAHIAARVAAIARAARATWMETGAEELAIGWPLLEGRAPDGTWLRGPLLLFPVALDAGEKRRAGRRRSRVTLRGVPDVNEPLAQTLARLAGVRLTLELMLDGDDDRAFRVDGETWAGLCRTLQAAGLRVSAPGAPRPLSPLEARGREERDRGPVDAWTLSSTAVLGRFPRAGSNIVADYDRLLADDVEALDLGAAGELLAVDEAEVVGDRAAPIDPDDEASSATGEAWRIDEDARRFQVLASDASQDEVFRFLEGARAGRGTGLVVQGPPGTGKSQLLTNLLAAAVGEGRRVLVVCQKRAALDVVAERMASVGLGRMLAVVHDTERDRNVLCAQIGETLAEVLDQALEDEPQPSESGPALQRFEHRITAVQGAWRSLTEGPPAVPGLADLFERALDDDGRPLPELHQDDLVDASEAALAAELPALEALADDTVPFARPHGLWVRTDWSDVDPATITESLDALAAAGDRLRELRVLEGAVDAARLGEAAPALRAASEVIDLFADPEGEGARRLLLFWGFTGGEKESGAWKRVMEQLRTAEGELEDAPRGLVSASTQDVTQWRDGLAELATLEGWTRVFTPRYWRLRRAQAAVADATASPTRPSALEGMRQCDAALGWHALIDALPDDHLILDLGFSGDTDELTAAIERLDGDHRRVAAVHALRAALVDVAACYRELPALGGGELAADRFCRAAVQDLARVRCLDAVAHTFDAVRGLIASTFLDDVHGSAASGSLDEAMAALDQVLAARADVDAARRVDTLVRDRPRFARAFLRQWAGSAGEEVADLGADAQLSLERAWRRSRLSGRSPRVLEAPLADPEQAGRLARERRDSLAAASTQIALRYRANLAARALDPVDGKQLRKLLSDVRKRRRRLTLRQLVETYWGAGLGAVRPVWLCSPESVAALFPLQSELFDQVIFDEASQCPVESAVPALARSRVAVIAGDDMQMPPAHFFRAAIDDEEEDDDDGEVLASQSVLELARVAFPSTTLRWHYRSRDESLVAFSNQAFYGGRLVTAPRAHHEAPAPGEAGALKLLQVEGRWNDQVNEAEADAVVDHIATALGRVQGPTAPSLGVVTFNRKQAELIERRLEERSAEDDRLASLLEEDAQRPPIEQLFVRNLENVQGDERDLILFSTGYGPSEPGGPIAARFGPLGQQGGERRLNVAITRARAGIVVVTSFLPSALRVEGTKHAGPKLLKSWLGYVDAVGRADRGEVAARLEEARALGGGRGHTAQARRRRTSDVGARLQRDLADALRARDLVVEQDAGLGSQHLDLVVGTHAGGASLGVDCRALWAESDPLVRELYRPAFWRRAGWEVVRVTPRMWLEEREEVIERLEALARGASSEA